MLCGFTKKYGLKREEGGSRKTSAYVRGIV